MVLAFSVSENENLEYFVFFVVNKKEKTVNIETNEGSSFLAEMGKDRFKVTYKRIDDHTLHMEIDDDKIKKGVNVYLTDTGNGKTISINGI